MSRSTWLRFNSSTAQLLLDIGECLENTLEVMHHPGSALVYGAYTSRKRREARERYLQKRAWKELERRKLIRTRRSMDRLEVGLTEQGLHQLLRLRLKAAGNLPDGHICIVIFDIPETHRRLRQNLRQVLKTVGFSRLQRSVWMTDKDAAIILGQLFDAVGAKQWIRVLDAVER